MRTFAIQIGSDIQGKRGKASRVGTDQDIIHEHVRFPIHGAEVQQDIFSFPWGGHRKGSFIPQLILLPHFFLHAGQGGFHGERHQDIPIETRRLCLSFRKDSVFPLAVQILPIRTFHPGAWIFWQYIPGIYFLSPVRLDLVSGGLPLRPGATNRCERTKG